MRKYPSIVLLWGLLLGICSQLSAATHIPFQFKDGLVWVKISVPGQPEKLNFLLDSGAGMSVIDSGTAQRLGLPLRGAERVQGVHGTVNAQRVDRFVGQLSSVSVPKRLLALDLSSVSAVCHQRVDGLLGADFFRNRIVQIDFNAKMVRLLSRGELSTANCEALPLVKRGDALCTQVSVEHGPPSWMRVDTGCNSALRWVVSSAAKKFLRRSSIGVAVRSPQYVATDVQLGSLQFRGVKTGIHQNQIFAGESGLLGNGMLSRFVVTFDVPGKRLLLRPR